jgi:hypothetical protein
MTTIKEAAKVYEPKRMKNIADLETVKVDVQFVENETRKDQDGQEYTVSYFIQDGEEYRVPASVLEQLKAILSSKPELQTFRVNKTGEGKGTKYQVIPLD